LLRFRGGLRESATKTMPSAPRSTTLRVSLNAVWPGTVASWKRIL
jgi:hypothetical protein